MDGIVPSVRYSDKVKLCRRLPTCVDARLRTRYLIVLNLISGRSARDTAAAVGVGKSTVYRVAERFREWGEPGLVDRREENGKRKVDEDFLAALYVIVAASPQKHGWKRPTWTREMLVITMKKTTGVLVHVTTMSRALKLIRARRGRPKPMVRCPWPDSAKNKRLAEIRRLLDNLPDDEVALYEDEVDIHLNPKIGLDWMVRGQQKEVETPGQNEKRYLAGAKDARTGELIWVEAEKKTSMLFILLLWELVQHYPEAKKIHLILDNYCIHHTQQVKISLDTPLGKRIELHFLPPYCPDENEIERTWQDLHAEVTRNHTCSDMRELMKHVRRFLKARNRKVMAEYRLAA
jgi:transposase